MGSECTVFRHGLIVDGTGTEPFPGDVVLRDGRIVSVGATTEGCAPAEPANVIDCIGKVIAPGFIDAHSHSDLQVLQNRTEKLLQGVTTEVVGNCGFSPYPMPPDAQVLREFANGILCGDATWGWSSAAEYLASARQSKTASVCSLVGHGALRIRVAGNTNRELTEVELDQMCGLLAEAIEQGAAGFSSGLMYAPGSGATMKELTALARVAARRNAVYATHMRSYSEGLVEAVEEQIDVAHAAGCALQISHLQAAGDAYWPLQQRAIERIEEAEADGVDVSFDAYPWLAGSTVMTQILPQWALHGGTAQLLKRLADSAERERIRPDIKPEARWTGVILTSVPQREDQFVGRSIAELAAERRSTPEDTVMDVLLEQDAEVMIVEHCQSRENLHALLTHPLATVVTDGVYTRGRSHPRLYATFPLLLGDLVRERKWLRLEEAIHKVTAKPAERFQMTGQGRIAPGYSGDLTVFDPNLIHTDATYERPDVAPTGICSVWRKGKMVVNSGTVLLSN